MKCLRAQHDEDEAPTSIAQMPGEVSSATPMVWGYYKSFAWNYLVFMIEAEENTGKDLKFRFTNRDTDPATSSKTFSIPLAYPRFAYTDAPNLIPTAADIKAGRTVGLLLLNLSYRPLAKFPTGAGDAAWAEFEQAARDFGTGEEKHPRGAELQLLRIVKSGRRLADLAERLAPEAGEAAAEFRRLADELRPEQ